MRALSASRPGLALLAGVAAVIAVVASCAPARAADPWPRRLPTLVGAEGRIAVGDLDGDGLDDFFDPDLPGTYLGDGALPDWSVSSDAWMALPEREAIRGAGGIAAGDVDGDGLADVAWAGWERSDGTPVVLVLYGAPGGVRAARWIDADPTPGSDFGATLAAGDVDGDHHADLAIASPALGRVVLHLGGPGGLEAREAWRASGPAGLGAALAMGDGDGVMDLAVSAGDTLRLYRGGPRGLGAAPVRELPLAPGAVIVSTGDLDGDGYGDLAAASPGATSLTLLFGAADPALMRTAAVATPRALAAGRPLAAVGDMNGDGYPELLLALAGDAPSGGGAVLVGGPSPGAALVPLAPPGAAGGAWAAGDLDNDGYADAVIGPSGVALGGATLFGAAVSAPGLAGRHVVCAGDVDGDGYQDLLMLSDPDDCRECAVVLARGGPALPEPAWQTTISRFDASSRPLAGPGDVDGDGYDDLLIGDPRAPEGAQANAGDVRLFWGSASGPVRETPTRGAWRVSGHGGQGLGYEVAGAGDLDGDGRADFCVADGVAAHGVNAWTYHLAGAAPAAWDVWESPFLGPEGADFRGVQAAGDLDGDWCRSSPTRAARPPTETTARRRGAGRRPTSASPSGASWWRPRARPSAGSGGRSCGGWRPAPRPARTSGARIGPGWRTSTRGSRWRIGRRRGANRARRRRPGCSSGPARPWSSAAWSRSAWPRGPARTSAPRSARRWTASSSGRPAPRRRVTSRALRPGRRSAGSGSGWGRSPRRSAGAGSWPARRAGAGRPGSTRPPRVHSATASP